MKNFQKIALSAVVGLMALGFSAFTTAKAEKAALLNVYHYTGVDGDGKITFEPGEPALGACSTGSTPCRWQTNNTMTSPLSKADIQSQASVTDQRP